MTTNQQQAAGETIEIKHLGVVALVRPTMSKGVLRFVADYRINGARKQVWRSTLEDAKAEAKKACEKIAAGETAVLNLTVSDSSILLRAQAALKGTGRAVDFVCAEYAEAVKLLGGKISLIEVCRDWSNKQAAALKEITIGDAVDNFIAKLSGKSDGYREQVEIALNRFAKNFTEQAATITASKVENFLLNLPGSERTKANNRDYIKALNSWLVLHEYLPKDADWFKGGSKFSKRKHTEAQVYTPEEMGKILNAATPAELPVIAIGGFSAMRHSEIIRLDWAQVELSDKPGESWIEVLPVQNTKSDQRRRLVPVSDNLKAWLKTVAKPSGRVCGFTMRQSTKALPRIVKRAGVAFKKNALRDSGISYRVAQTGDVARIADESGNSPAIIRSNYLRRVKPAQAVEWFGIVPPAKN